MLLHELNIVNIDTLRQQKSPKILGNGIQGVALASNKPNTVRKVYGFDDWNDPYFQFIKLIEQHQDNPFFPRIYRHTVYKNTGFKQGYNSYFQTGVVMMEKLQPLAKMESKIPHEVVQALFKNIGIEFNELYEIYGFFENRKAIQQIINTTPNEKFAEALRLLVSTGRNAFDLHFGNWMIRLTSVGPQLVILDPMYGSDVNTGVADPESSSMGTSSGSF